MNPLDSKATLERRHYIGIKNSSKAPDWKDSKERREAMKEVDDEVRARLALSPEELKNA